MPRKSSSRLLLEVSGRLLRAPVALIDHLNEMSRTAMVAISPSNKRGQSIVFRTTVGYDISAPLLLGMAELTVNQTSGIIDG